MVTVIVPVYNEIKTIEKVIHRLCLLPDIDKIIIVDDGSSDGTTEVLHKLCDEGLDIQVIYQKINQGRGAAIQAAWSEVDSGVVIHQDADLEYHVEDIPKITSKVSSSKMVCCLGSRIKASRGKMKMKYYLANKMLSITATLRFGLFVSDLMTCYKAYPICLVEKSPRMASGFSFEADLLKYFSKTGVKISEVNIKFSPRSRGDGKKIKLIDFFYILAALIRR